MISALLTVIALSGCGIFKPPEPPPPTSVDYWTYMPLATDASAFDALTQLKSPNPTREVYFESAYLLQNNPAKLEQLIADLAAKNIQLSMMFGDSEWVRPARQGEALELARQAMRFINDLKSRNRPLPRAVQFDVEPQALPDWNDNMTVLSNQYLGLLEDLGSLLKGTRFAAAVPFWFDGVVATHKGVSRPLQEWTQDLTDEVVIMNYRDQVYLQVNAAQTEVDYATRTGKRIVLGLESQCFSDPSLASITHCEEGRKVLDSNLQYLAQSFSRSSGFAGVAVFSLETYRTMRE